MLLMMLMIGMIMIVSDDDGDVSQGANIAWASEALSAVVLFCCCVVVKFLGLPMMALKKQQSMLSLSDAIVFKHRDCVRKYVPYCACFLPLLSPCLQARLRLFSSHHIIHE